ncbi:MAG: signal recognition particle receptor subunit alpha, partial [Clostridia bacterium]
MGLFSKIAQGLKKTKENISKKLYQLFVGRELDDEFFDELEEALITSDIGVAATEQILDDFKDKCFEKKLKKSEDAKEFLRQIMIESIEYDIEPYTYPLVILVAGVNGVGKTTALGKLAKYFREQGKSVVLA